MQTRTRLTHLCSCINIDKSYKTFHSLTYSICLTLSIVKDRNNYDLLALSHSHIHTLTLLCVSLKHYIHLSLSLSRSHTPPTCNRSALSFRLATRAAARSRRSLSSARSARARASSCAPAK